MIASLRGTLEALNPDSAVINVGGVGFRVFMPVSTLLTLGGLGEEVRVQTHTHVREDAILLYGFASEEDLKLFEMLILEGAQAGLAWSSGKLRSASK